MGKKLGALLLKYLKITGGCLIYAVGIAVFLDPNKLAPGGITGIAIIISHMTALKTGTLAFLINVPLMLYGWKKFGREFFVSTFYAAFVSSAFLNLMNRITDGKPIATDNLMLAGIIGGVVMALGMGLIFKCGATTAGSDIIVRALRQRFQQIKTGSFYMITDACVITASAIVFRNVEVALFAAVSLFISSTFLDIVLYGNQGAKLLYVISNQSDEIAARILKEVDIGATFLDAKGAFTNHEKEVILCAVRKYNYMKVREIIRQVDKDAFVIVSSANEIFGEGYKDHYAPEV